MYKPKSTEERMEDKLKNAEYLSKAKKQILDHAVERGSEMAILKASQSYVLSLMVEGDLHRQCGIGNASDFYLRAASVASEHGLDDLEKKASELLANNEVEKALKQSEGFNKFLDCLY